MSDILGGIISGIGGVVGAGVNAQTAADINRQNLQFQQENLQYQKDIQQQVFAREDSAVERRVADLRRSGLSPVLAAGQGAQSGAIVSTKAPEYGTNPRFGDIASKLGEMPSAMLDYQSAALRNEQQAQNIAQSRAETDLVESQAELARGSVGTRIHMLQMESDSKFLKLYLDKLYTGTVAAYNLEGANAGQEWPKELISLGITPGNSADPAFMAQMAKARAEAQREGIGAQFDQLMLDWEKSVGRIIRTGQGFVGMATDLVDSVTKSLHSGSNRSRPGWRTY